MSMILSLDRSIYGKPIKDLSKYYSMGTNQYSWTRTKMHNTIVHWRNQAARYDLHVPPGTVVFAQDNCDGPTSGEMNDNGGQKEPRELSKVKGFK